MCLRPLMRCWLLLILPVLVFAQLGYPRRTRSAGPNNGAPGGATPLVTMRGTLRNLDKKQIVVNASGDQTEDQILTFKRSKKTRFLKGAKQIQPDEFKEGAAVVIEASRALNGDYDAVNVFLGEPPAPAAPK